MPPTNHPLPGPIVSVVIATRNRHERLDRLLSSAALQDLKEIEIIVADDNSDATTLDSYYSMRGRLDSRFRFLSTQFPGGPGSGPSAPRNRGVEASSGRYVALCDDDDVWTARDHLSVAANSLDRYEGDLFFAGMRLVDGAEVKGTWYSPPVPAHGMREITANPPVYEVPMRAFAASLRRRSPCVSTVVFRRQLYDEVGGFWEKLRFYEDVDFILRAADRARRILFRPAEVTDFFVDPHPRAYTAVSELERALFAVTACQHSRAHVRHPLLLRNARAREAWSLLTIARHALANGGRRAGRSLLEQSFLLHPSRSVLVEWLRSWVASPAQETAGNAETSVD